MPNPGSNGHYCSYGGHTRCSTAREPTLPPMYRVNQDTQQQQRLPRKISPDGMPMYRTEPTPAYQPAYPRFGVADAASGFKSGQDQVMMYQRAASNFPPRRLPPDVAQYYHSGPMAYGQGFGPTGGSFPSAPPRPPAPQCPQLAVPDTSRRKHQQHGGVKPWSAHPPDPSVMEERMRKYRNDHKISGFAGFFPSTYNLLGGSIYRIVTLEEEAYNKPENRSYGGRS